MNTVFEHLHSTPEWYPLAIDPIADRVRFASLSEEDYRSASFLDSRLRIPDSTGVWLDWSSILQAGKTDPPRCHFIFHISHVGSTLLARLTGEHPRLFSVREPILLRFLAERHPTRGVESCPWEPQVFAERSIVCLKFWSRTYNPSATAVIKATSFVSEIACDLLETVSHSHAILMTVTPQVFLKTMLTGAMNDIDQQAEHRLIRLHRRLGETPWRIPLLSPGERIAMSWLCEMLALSDLADRFPSRSRWLDFDQFLHSPADELAQTFQHYQVDADRMMIDRIVNGPMLSQYAKAPEHAFDASTRQQLLQQAERTHLAEIHKGLEWLRKATRYPEVHDLLEKTANRYESQYRT